MQEIWVQSLSEGKIPCIREWQHTPVFLPGKFHGQRSLVGYSSWGLKESDTIEQLTFSLNHRAYSKFTLSPCQLSLLFQYPTLYLVLMSSQSTSSCGSSLAVLVSHNLDAFENRWSVILQCVYSAVILCPTLCDPMDYSTPGFPVLHFFLEFAQIQVHKAVMLSNHLIFCCPLLLLPSVFPNIRSFPMSWLFASGDQSIRASASASP